MANRLRMDQVKAIEALKRQGWSNRRIGRELGIHRTTVSAYLQSKPTKVTAGSSGSAGSPERGQASLCAEHRGPILAKLEQGLSAQRIFQDLRSESSFAGSYESVKRFVRGLRASHPLPFRRLECEAGAEAQIDFGQAAPVVDGQGKRRRPHVLRVVLSHSRKGYSEAVSRQTTENFIRALENAFWSFGGVPRTLVIDNLRAAVKKADWFDPELNPKVQSFAEHYGTVILPTRVSLPRHKGKVERGVDYVQENALRGRRFGSLAEQNEHLRGWERHVADTRIHGTTREQVGKAFAERERAALLPLPAERFPYFQEAERTVHRDGHVAVEKAYYSAPPEYLGRKVWVRWDARLVRLFDQRLQSIAIHPRQEPGRFSTQQAHLRDEKISGVERGATWWLQKAWEIGPKAHDWAAAMLRQRGIAGVRVLMGLQQLAAKHPRPAIDAACAIANSYGEYRLATVRNLIGRQAPVQQEFEFAAEHDVIRPLVDYSEFVQSCIRKEPCS